MTWLLVVVILALAGVSVLAVRLANVASAERRRADTLLSQLRAAEEADVRPLAPAPLTSSSGALAPDAVAPSPVPPSDETSGASAERREAEPGAEGEGEVPGPEGEVPAGAEGEVPAGAEGEVPAGAEGEVPAGEPTSTSQTKADKRVSSVGDGQLTEADAEQAEELEPEIAEGAVAPQPPVPQDVGALVETLWALELTRQQRDWLATAAPTSGRSSVAREPAAELTAALSMELERLREEVGVSGSVRSALSGPIPVAAALVALRLAQEALAVLVPSAEAIDVELAAQPGWLSVRLISDGWEEGRGSSEALRVVATAAKLAGGELSTMRADDVPMEALLRVPLAAIASPAPISA